MPKFEFEMEIGVQVINTCIGDTCIHICVCLHVYQHIYMCSYETDGPLSSSLPSHQLQCWHSFFYKGVDNWVLILIPLPTNGPNRPIGFGNSKDGCSLGRQGFFLIKDFW